MSVYAKFAIVAGLSLLCFALGRYTVPEKVKIETKIVEVEKKTKSDKKEVVRHRETTTTEVTRPDGTKEKTIVVVEDTESKSTSKESDKITKKETDKKEVTRSGSPVTIAALAGVKLGSFTDIDYGVSVSKPILGPISIGAFGFTSRRLGVQIGLSL